MTKKFREQLFVCSNKLILMIILNDIYIDNIIYYFNDYFWIMFWNITRIK